MSELVKDEAIILRSYGYGETSMILSVVSRRNGKVRLLAKGARRRRRSIAGNVRAGSIGEVVYYYKEKRGLQTLKEATFSEGFYTDSFEKICIFQAVLELAGRIMVEGGGDEKAFDIIKDSIEALKDAVDPWLIFFACEVGLIMINGTYPDSSRCGKCWKPLEGEVFVDAGAAEFLCGGCRSEGTIRLSGESFGLMKSMETSPPSRFKEGTVDLLRRKEIGRVLHYIMLHHVEGYSLPASLKMLQEVD